MDNFDKEFAKTRNIIVLGIIAKLMIICSLIWLAIYAINALTT